jgi:hypothetical protein
MFAVVAIPRQDDYVWNISSEKVPHMTLVAFEDPNWTPEQLSRVTGYIEHAASMLARFGMDVDRRGELGDKNADVLFFTKGWNFAKIEQFRSNLLANRDINHAVRSDDRFPDWIPHLTLGFPESPAKKDKRDYPGTSWVSFDQIAFWTDNYSGPSFRLKSDDSFEVAMSSTPRQGTEVVDDILEHYGVKGMRWGIRRRSGATSPGSDDYQRSTAAKAKIKTGGGTKALSNKELQDLVTRMNLEQQFSRLQPPTKKKKAATFVASVLANVGKQQVTRVANDVATKQISTMLAKAAK